MGRQRCKRSRVKEKEKWSKEIKGRMKVREKAFDGQTKGNLKERENNGNQSEKGKWNG